MRQNTATRLIKKVEEDYSKIAREFSETRNRSWNEFKLFEKYLDSNSLILDVGCGNGRLLNTLLKGSEFKSYFGIDVSSDLLKEARKNARFRRNVFFKKGSILKLPIKNNVFDSVFCIAVLHHIPAPFQAQALSELKRVMKKNSYLFLTVWNLRQKKYRKYAFKAYIKSILTLGEYGPNDLFIPWKKELKRYYYSFTPSKLRRMLEVSGFQVVKEELTDFNFCYICSKK